jgi:hypothetical protein
MAPSSAGIGLPYSFAGRKTCAAVRRLHRISPSISATKLDIVGHCRMYLQLIDTVFSNAMSTEFRNEIINFPPLSYQISISIKTCEEDTRSVLMWLVTRCAQVRHERCSGYKFLTRSALHFRDRDAQQDVSRSRPPSTEHIEHFAFLGPLRQQQYDLPFVRQK